MVAEITSKYRDIEIYCQPNKNYPNYMSECYIQTKDGKKEYMGNNISILEIVTKKGDYVLRDGFKFRATIRGEVECKKKNGGILVCKVFPDIK